MGAAHFVYHYLGHKVRLFWCLHSSHHAPENMNLLSAMRIFFLSSLRRCDTDFPLHSPRSKPSFVVFYHVHRRHMGAFIHVGENTLKDARLGFLNRFYTYTLSPSCASCKNPLYMTRNFCNLLNIWDRVFAHCNQKEGMFPFNTE